MPKQQNATQYNCNTWHLTSQMCLFKYRYDVNDKMIKYFI